jgi:XTP/dITP diphosphohydrolase
MSASLNNTLENANVKVVAATRNLHKIKEIQAITKEAGFQIITRDEAGVPEDFDVEEDGHTFEENSLKKARAIMDLVQLPAVADDSGLEVDALGGAPGVYSARYAGIDGPEADAANRVKLLKELNGVPWAQRTGRFVAAITLVFPDGQVVTARGECEGIVGTEEKGSQGFGYDCLFHPQGESRTFGEISSEEKNQISHRAKALQKLALLLEGKGHERKIP